jgi:hypothetical protein
MHRSLSLSREIAIVMLSEAKHSYDLQYALVIGMARFARNDQSLRVFVHESGCLV